MKVIHIMSDGSIKEFNKGISPREIAQSISSGLAKKSMIAKINVV